MKQLFYKNKFFYEKQVFLQEYIFVNSCIFTTAKICKKKTAFFFLHKNDAYLHGPFFFIIFPALRASCLSEHCTCTVLILVGM